MAEAKSSSATKDKQYPAEFLRSCRAELDKVVWPSKDDTKKATIMAIVIMCLMAGLLALLDLVFNELMSAII